MIVSALQNYRISPSDLVFLYEECKRCFYDTVKNGFKRPRSFSPHFTNADRAMRRAMAEQEIVNLGEGVAPRFKVISQAEWVESLPIPFEQHGVSLSFFGQYDAVVVDEEDKIFVVDYKTTTLDDGALMKYRRALMCYVTAIELTKSGTTPLPAYVDGMALLVFNPSDFTVDSETKRCGLTGKTRWVELPRKNDLFDSFLQQVAALLADTIPPPKGRNCGICQLRFRIGEDDVSLVSP